LLEAKTACQVNQESDYNRRGKPNRIWSTNWICVQALKRSL